MKGGDTKWRKSKAAVVAAAAAPVAAAAAAAAAETAKPQYGRAGDVLPVRPGEVWGIGPHAFFCGDLAASPLHRPVPFIVVSDPPWGLGNLNAFQSRAGLLHRPSYAEFITQFFQATAGAQELFLEMGLTWEGEVVAHARSCGWRLTERWMVSYRSGSGHRPNALLHFGGLPLGWNPAAMTRHEFLRAICLNAHLSGVTTVVDPCLGLGGTLRAADDMGLACTGSELHPRRLAHALLTLSKRTEEQPRRLDGPY